MKPTREQILNATPKELDRWCAEYVMGWEKSRHLRSNVYEGEGLFDAGFAPSDRYISEDHLPRFSSNISAAWRVIEEMDCGCIQWDVDTFEVEIISECITGFAEAPTAPEAICRAALLAVITSPQE